MAATGRRSAAVPLGWGAANVLLLVVLMAFGGDTLEGSAAGVACTIIEVYAVLLYLGRRREAATAVVQPVARSGWPSLLLAVALVLLCMALPYGIWPAVVAPVPLFAAGYLALAPRRRTAPTLQAATATVVTAVGRDAESMGEDDRAAAFLAAAASGVEGRSPEVAQAMLTRPPPPPSFEETAAAAAAASGATAAGKAATHRRRRRARLARAGRAISAAVGVGVLLARRHRNRRSWE